MYEIPYRQEGDYLVPDLILEVPEERPFGKYGRMRERYLKEHRRGLHAMLEMKLQLNGHLADIDEQARDQVENLVTEMARKDPSPDKATDQMGWVGHMNNLKASAEEIVIRELIFN